MSNEPFQLGDWWVEPELNLLRADETEVQLEPRLMKALLVLVEHAGRVVSKETLVTRVWDDLHVTSDTVSVAIYELRKALRDNAKQPAYIKTIRKSGFQLIAMVRITDQNSEEQVGPGPSASPVATAEPSPMSTPLNDESGEHRIASILAHFHLPHWHLPRLPRKSWFFLLLVLAALVSLFIWDQGRERSIAVLPLVLMSEDREPSMFAEGMTEALITDLARDTKLRVLPRSVVQSFADSKRPPRAIGRQLGVDYLLEGGVQVLNGEVVVTLRVIDIEDENHVWSNSYKKPIRDFFQIQAEASLDLAQHFTGAKRTSAPNEPDLDADAYYAYLNGRHFLNRGTLKDVEKALPYFRMVLKRAPNYAPAHAALAHCYVFYGEDLTAVDAQEARKLAGQHVLRGIELDPRIAELHLLHAVLLFRDQWAFPEAEAEFRAALELHRTDPRSHQWYALFLSALGRSEAALEAIDEALYLAPNDLDVRFSRVRVLIMASRWDEAKGELDRILAERPDFGKAQLLAFLVRQRGVDPKLFLPSLANWVRSQEHASAVYLELQGISGERALSPSQRQASSQGREEVGPVFMALINLYAGRKDNALAWLERAMAVRQNELVYLGADPMFAPLSGDKRFKKLLERMSLPHSSGRAYLVPAGEPAQKK